MRVLVLLLLLSHFASASPAMQLQGIAEFSATEQQKLKIWLEQSFNATNQLLGPYPFLTQVYLSRRVASEPVPWAYTQRMDTQQVFFQVDSSFALSEFQQDWTAAHEFSHLALPLLDREDLWFAEGFASYMQYQVLQLQHQLAEGPAYWYQQKLQRLAPLLEKSELPFVSQLKLWLKQKHYKAAYWGSALFFIEADHLLQKQGSSLSQLIQQYQQQNRLTDQNLPQLLDSLDALADKAVFTVLFRRYQQQTGHSVWRQHPAFFAAKEHVAHEN
jgi:hypothetical protein